MVLPHSGHGQDGETMPVSQIHQGGHVVNGLSFIFSTDKDLDCDGGHVQSKGILYIHGNVFVGNLFQDTGATAGSKHHASTETGRNGGSKHASSEHESIAGA